jgi:hypothetical protein
MKKTLSLLTILSLMTAACNKEYKCSCSAGIGGFTYIKGTVKAISKKKANERCASTNSDEYCVAQ